jgi:hypothetical protein
MPILVAFFLNTIGALVAFFAQTVVRRFALVAALITSAVAAFGVMSVALDGILGAIAYSFPAAAIIAASWVVPPNWNEAIAAYFAGRVVIFGFRWSFNILAVAAGAKA